MYLITMPIDNTTIITPGGGTTSGNIGEFMLNQKDAYSNNPASITIGEGNTSTFKFTYNSPGTNQQIYINTSTNDVINNVTFTTSSVPDVKPTIYQATVTVSGAKNSGGTASFTVTTYDSTMTRIDKTTTVSVQGAIDASQINFFDNRNQLELDDSKLIAPKYIYTIEQGKTDPAQGIKADKSTKCLKTANDTAYVKFEYMINTGS